MQSWHGKGNWQSVIRETKYTSRQQQPKEESQRQSTANFLGRFPTEGISPRSSIQLESLDGEMISYLKGSAMTNDGRI